MSNEEDHTRIISMQMGADIKEVFTRFCQATSKVEGRLRIMSDPDTYIQRLQKESKLFFGIIILPIRMAKLIRAQQCSFLSRK